MRCITGSNCVYCDLDKTTAESLFAFIYLGLFIQPKNVVQRLCVCVCVCVSPRACGQHTQLFSMEITCFIASGGEKYVKICCIRCYFISNLKNSFFLHTNRFFNVNIYIITVLEV